VAALALESAATICLLGAPAHGAQGGGYTRSTMRVLVSIGGHSFDRAAFDALLASLPNTSCEVVKHPAAARRMNPHDLRDFDALLLYDLPGIDFHERAAAPQFLEPAADFMSGFEAMFDAGIGIVALHHALAGWPAWPRYAEILGGTFLYRPGTVRGRKRPDSGYAPDIEYRAQLARADHPIAAGLPISFLLKDELYLCEVFTNDIEPLLHADYSFESQHFLSAAAAVRGVTAMASPRTTISGTNTIGWTRRVDRSRIVYLQPGDSAQTLQNPLYQRLVANALHWAATR
jgi:uncharacterized protein